MSEINQNVKIVEDSGQVTIKETIDVIDFTDATTLDIGSLDAFPAIGAANAQLKHQILNGRELPDQHPITAITGLREELNEIERFKTVYSDQANIANYYEWGDGAHDDYGYFVSLIPNTTTVKICDGSDILGVTVKSAGFVGNENQQALRDNRYCLVVTSGLVGVRCEGDVQVGDCVVSNDYGVAERVYNAYGYEVMALKDIGGTTYAVIDLKVQIRKVRALASAIDVLDRRVDKAETDIVAAINVSQQAYNKASDTDKIAREVLDKVGDVIVKVDTNTETTNRVEQSVAETNRIAVEAKELANLAATSAESIRAGAEKTANESLASVNRLIEDLEPIMTWEDPESDNIGAEYFTNYIKNGVATKQEISTIETLTEQNKSSLERSAESFRSLVSSVDKYSVGELSQSYGLSREQAAAILKIGMIYVPTKHSDSESHSETFVGEVESQEFTPGSYYEWGINDHGQHDWIEYANSVAFGMFVPSYTDQLRYWYVDSDESPEGYEAYTLYSWINEKWTKVNIYYNNPNNRVVSAISQDVDSIALEVANARGGYAGLDLRLEADNEAQATMIASVVDEKGNVTAASIINAVNKDKSSVTIEANHILLNGYNITNGNASFQINNEGHMIASGGRIANWNITTDQLWSEMAGIYSGSEHKYASGITEGGSPIRFYSGASSSENPENAVFKVLDDGSLFASAADITGKITATSGYIGNGTNGFEINESYISNAKSKYNDNNNGVYIGTDGIGLGAGKFYVDSQGNITLKGNITWGDNAPNEPGEIVYLYYLSDNTSAPNTPYYNGTTLESGWTLCPSGVTYEMPYEYISQCTIKDNNYTCSSPVLWTKYSYDGSNAEVTDEAIFQILTGGEKCGIFPYADNKLYISASSIKTGSLLFNNNNYYFNLNSSGDNDTFVSLPSFSITGTTIQMGANNDGSGLSGITIANEASNIYMYGETCWGESYSGTRVRADLISAPSLLVSGKVDFAYSDGAIDVYDAIVDLQKRVTVLEGGHVHNYTIDEQIAATCTAYGHIKKTCTICGTTTAETLPMISHNYTSSTSGNTTTYTCTECGKTYTETTGGGGSGETCNHDWRVISMEIEPTCTEDGEAIYKCYISTCGETKRDSLPALGHTPHDSWTPTDPYTGEHVKQCTFCGEVAERESCAPYSDGTTGICGVCGNNYFGWFYSQNPVND